jgi:hypothetical protein
MRVARFVCKQHKEIPMASLRPTPLNRNIDSGLVARGINALAGLWLIVSAYVWPHTSEQSYNAWIVGVLALIAVAIATFVMNTARYANTALGAWLILSAYLLPTAAIATMWNNVIVGLVMFVCSLVPGGMLADLMHRRSVLTPHR